MARSQNMKAKDKINETSLNRNHACYRQTPEKTYGKLNDCVKNDQHKQTKPQKIPIY